MIATMMRAAYQDLYGPALAVREVPVPTPGAGEVLVRVRAAAVNPADWGLSHGVPYFLRLGFGLRRPKRRIPGQDVAGVVAAVGPGVDRLRVGDEVFGEGRGTFAEYAVAKADHLDGKPADATFEEAAAATMAGLTALQLLQRADVRPGQRVAVTGAGGGIGTFAVQIAKTRDAEVTAVCSAGKAELVRSLGADHVVDYASEDFTRAGAQYDLILDNVSEHPLSDLRRALNPRGILLPNGGRFDNRWFGSVGRLIRVNLWFMFLRQRTFVYVSSPNQADLRTLSELIGSRQVKPVVSATYPLERAGEALALVGEGHTTGKVVVTVD